MTLQDTAKVYRQKLETLLAEDFYAEGGDLAAKVAGIGAGWPEDLAAFLRDLAATGRGLDGAQISDGEALEFAFRCGQAVERLEAFKQRRVDESLAAVRADGMPMDPLAEEELDTMARLLAARDRVVKAVADFTLKALLFCLGLLVLWLLANLI